MTTPAPRSPPTSASSRGGGRTPHPADQARGRTLQGLLGAAGRLRLGNETLDQCAARELEEETGVSGLISSLRNLQRSEARSPLPRHHRRLSGTRPGKGPCPEVRHGRRRCQMAFPHPSAETRFRSPGDHQLRPRHAVGEDRPRAIGSRSAPEHFTLTQIQKVYEAILGTPIDKRNFRRSILSKGWIAETGVLERGRQRPAMTYTTVRVA